MWIIFFVSNIQQVWNLQSNIEKNPSNTPITPYRSTSQLWSNFEWVILHLIFLHSTGSNNPLGINADNNKIKLFPFFLFKDIFLIGIQSFSHKYLTIIERVNYITQPMSVDHYLKRN